MTRPTTPLGFAVLALTLAACAGGDDGGAGAGGADDGFAATVAPLFEAACNCHQTTPLKAPFSLKGDEAYDNIVNVPASELPTMNLVTPGKPEDSYLWHKIDGTQVDVGGSGSRMPLNSPLHDDEKAIVERWILAGAPP